LFYPPPPTYNFDLSITPNPVCVGSQSTYTISNATSDLDGKQIYWSSTKNGVSTGEVLSGYTGQIVNSNGSWSGLGTPAWDSSEIGSWVKTASFVDSTGKVLASKSQSFVVKDCSTPPPPTYNFDLSITPNPVCVGSQSTYTISNATSDLDGKQIYWSSTKNGVSTGEVLSGYTGQIVNSNGSWSGLGTPAWDSSEIGSWVKTASLWIPPARCLLPNPSLLW